MLRCITTGLVAALALSSAAVAEPTALEPAGEIISTEGLPEVEGNSCLKIGQEDCVATLVLTAEATDDLTDELWDNQNIAGSILQVALTTGAAEPAGSGGHYFYYWLKEDIKPDDYLPPWNLTRCVDYHGSGGNNYTLSEPRFLSSKDGDVFPEVERADRSAPDLVIWCPGMGGYATGVIHPKSWTADIQQAFWCPEAIDVTSFPNRVTERQGLRIDYADFQPHIETYIDGALYVR